MSLKDQVKRGGDWHPARIAIYGDPKAGKTTFGAQSPSPVFLGGDDGRRRLQVDGFDLPATWNEFLAQVELVAKEGAKSGYKTVVIDTLNSIVDLCAVHVCDEKFGGDWHSQKNGFYSWGGSRGWTAVADEMKRLLDLLNGCINNGMWVLILAHSGVKNVVNPVDGDYHRFAPSIDKRVWAAFSAWLDVIARVDYRTSTVERDGKRILVSDGSRVLRTAATVGESAGCRAGYELPAQIPLAWASVEEHLGQQDEDVVAQLAELWDKMDEAREKKALKFLGISSKDEISKAPTHLIKTAIGQLRG